jgi:hypothetical protein
MGQCKDDTGTNVSVFRSARTVPFPRLKNMISWRVSDECSEATNITKEKTLKQESFKGRAWRKFLQQGTRPSTSFVQCRKSFRH